MREFFSTPESFFMVLVVIALIGGFYSNQWGPLWIIILVYTLAVLFGVI